MELGLRTPVIAGNLYINCGGYQGLCADGASPAFEVSRGSADNILPLNMASDAPPSSPHRSLQVRSLIGCGRSSYFRSVPLAALPSCCTLEYCDPLIGTN